MQAEVFFIVFIVKFSYNIKKLKGDIVMNTITEESTNLMEKTYSWKPSAVKLNEINSIMCLDLASNPHPYQSTVFEVSDPLKDLITDINKKLRDTTKEDDVNLILSYAKNQLKTYKSKGYVKNGLVTDKDEYHIEYGSMVSQIIPIKTVPGVFIFMEKDKNTKDVFAKLMCLNAEKLAIEFGQENYTVIKKSFVMEDGSTIKSTSQSFCNQVVKTGDKFINTEDNTVTLSMNDTKPHTTTKHR